ncbi:MAG: zinc ribbon domain-containing protein [Candidatus Marinimicrobia bacterium]|nr:zinc ribbon domain-containing protein [bacterium]MCG2715560.1 zinc ribbon domain-containing protein [Candidatus Neomarinimicrobiota bacterium]
MPTYDYFCKNCQYEFEAFQSMSADPIKICPKCEQASIMRRISGGTGLIFKGSGFYITDYTKKNSSTSTKESKSKTSTSAAKTEKSTSLSKESVDK